MTINKIKLAGSNFEPRTSSIQSQLANHYTMEFNCQSWGIIWLYAKRLSNVSISKFNQMVFECITLLISSLWSKGSKPFPSPCVCGSGCKSHSKEKGIPCLLYDVVPFHIDLWEPRFKTWARLWTILKSRPVSFHTCNLTKFFRCHLF